MTHPTLPTSPADQVGETPFGLNEADVREAFASYRARYIS